MCRWLGAVGAASPGGGCPLSCGGWSLNVGGCCALHAEVFWSGVVERLLEWLVESLWGGSLAWVLLLVLCCVPAVVVESESVLCAAKSHVDCARAVGCGKEKAMVPL